MNYLSLFSGAGGGDLALQKLLGFRCLGYVEYEKYAQRVLAQRIGDGHLDRAPIFGDIRVFNHKWAFEYKGMVDLVAGGFPCQPWSTAARGKNTAADLWPEMLKVVGKVEPRFVFAENVDEGAIVHAQNDLAMCGFKTARLMLSAGDMGADHPRRRWWMVADADNKSELGCKLDAEVAVLEARGKNIWKTKPGSIGIFNGMAHRMERFKAVGEGQVPIVAATAWEILTS